MERIRLIKGPKERWQASDVKDALERGNAPPRIGTSDEWNADCTGDFRCDNMKTINAIVKKLKGKGVVFQVTAYL